MRASAWRFGIWAVSVLAVAAAPAKAVIVYGDPGRLTTLPTLSGGVKPGWQFLGTYGQYTGIPIGPRAWITATHVSGGTGTLTYDNAGTTGSISYASTRVATSGDLAVFQLNGDQPDFTEWAPVWSDTTTLTDRVTAGTLDVYMYGRGTGRGTAIDNGSGTVGWNWLNQAGNEPISYGTGEVFDLVNDSGNIYLQMPFFADTPTSGIFSTGDSGGAVFAFDNVDNRWEVIGINYAVDTVYAAPDVPLSNYLRAAFFDARGYYFYNGTQWVQISAPGPVTLSSYSTALPQKYSVLAPFIPVPEPSTVVLALVSAAGTILAVRRGKVHAG